MSPEAAARLAELRARVDQLDDALLALVAERAAAVDAIFALKQAEQTPLHDPAREAQIAARLRASCPERVDPAAVDGLVSAVLRACRPRGRP